MNEDFDAKLRSVLIDGPQPATVEIVAYDETWPERFAEFRSALRGRLGPRAIRIEHIGSTSVPGLAAKNIIDICLTVADPDDEPAYLDDLLSLGWTLAVREPGHRVVRYADPKSNLHVFADDASEVTDYLTLRDWLRAHADDRDRYAALKRDLASRGEWPDINYYADAKGPFIRELLATARGTSR